MNIPFSPPDINDDDINSVVETLKSGWITTGPKTKLFENAISQYCNVERTVCLNSGTASLELILRMFDIGPGDEVITSPYTYASTANVILHVGAKPVFADIKKNEFNIDPDCINSKITKKTKAVICIDFAGWSCDYDEIKEVLNSNKKKYNPYKNTKQKNLDRILLISDAAHAFGSSYKNTMTGGIADFTAFSFHAVKNLTTAEGGAISFNSLFNLQSEDLYKEFMLLSLHGQNKDALSKLIPGAWRYDIELAGYKYNMTDLAASLGLTQLKRYDSDILLKRQELFILYNEYLNNEIFITPPFNDENKKNSYHLYPLRIKGIDEEKRNEIILKSADYGISTNVHFIPLVMHSLYKNLGYKITDYPNTYEMFKNEITLPLYTRLKYSQIEYICNSLKNILNI